MSVKIKLSAELRRYCDGHPDLEIDAVTVGDVLQQLESNHPKLFRSICVETGEIRPHVNLFINDGLVRARGAKLSHTGLSERDVLGFFPAVSGG